MPRLKSTRHKPLIEKKAPKHYHKPQKTKFYKGRRVLSTQSGVLLEAGTRVLIAPVYVEYNTCLCSKEVSSSKPRLYIGVPANSITRSLSLQNLMKTLHASRKMNRDTATKIFSVRFQFDEAIQGRIQGFSWERGAPLRNGVADW